MLKALTTAISILIACAPAVAEAQLYVSRNGSNSNPGTQSAPLATILAASRKATAGTTIYVEPGTYPGGVQTTVSGTATAHIHYLSTTKYGAELVPPAGSTSSVAWWIKGDYTDVDGFEIDGTNFAGGINWTVGIEADGNNDTVENNLIHNIHDLNVTSCSSHGAAGIDFYGFYYGKSGGIANANIIHDVTWHGTCGFDQGLYLSSAGIVVTNNLIYSIIGGSAISAWHAATNLEIVNNTIYGSYAGIYIGHDAGLGGIVITHPGTPDEQRSGYAARVPRRSPKQDLPLALAVLTTERKAA